MEVAFEAIARPLVVLHALAAIVLIGASTHHAIVAVGYLRGVYRTRLGRTYAAVVAVSYLVTFSLGAAAYPTFRTRVRGEYLDAHAPWASNLFDIKEHFASLGLPLVLGAFALSRALDPKHDAALRATYAVMVGGGALVVWFDVIAGLLVTLARGV